MRHIIKFLKEEDGPTAVEYAVMLALILVVIMGSVGMVGQTTAELMDPNGQLTGTLRAAGT